MLTRGELEHTCDEIVTASVPEMIFGKTITRDELNARYRDLAKVLHPDLFIGTPSADTAARAFLQLTAMRDLALVKFDSGTYGDMSPPRPPEPPRAPLVVKVRGTTYTVGDLLVRGDVADVYRCESGGEDLVLKIAQRASDNDLLQNEVKRLKVLNPRDAKNTHARYMHDIVDSFMLKGAKTSRQVNVFRHYPEHVTLDAVHTRYPSGLDYRDVAWMLKRLLEALGYVHGKGIVHGAILPPHLLVHPIEHGAKLIGWGCGVDIGKPLLAISAPWKSFYPPEVFAKRAVTPATDLYMASRTALWLIGDSGAPRAIVDFLRANLLAQRHRSQDAWVMHDEFSALLKRLLGPPRYRALVM